MQLVQPTAEIEFERNRILLDRYRFIEYQALRILAAWLPAPMASHGIERPVAAFIDETVALWNREYISATLPLHGA